MSEASPLGPIDPSSIADADQQNAAETEKRAPWIVRKLVGVSIFWFNFIIRLV